MKPSPIYGCSDCQLYFKINVVPPPDRPDAKQPPDEDWEYCPRCGTDLAFTQVEDEVGE